MVVDEVMTAKEIIKVCCEEFLKNCGLSEDNIRKLNFRNLLLSAYRIVFRLIPVMKYKVYTSKELEEQLEELSRNDKEGVKLVIKEFSEGKDVNYRLSKQVWHPNPYYTDHLLAEWNIYHLHLGLEREENSFFAKRTRNLIYVLINRGSAFFIKCLPHEFEKLELIEIIENNWPHLLEPRKLPEEVIALSYEPSEEAIRCARRKKVASGVRANLNLTVRGRKGFYVPYLGVASDGTPVAVSLSVLDTVKVVEEMEKQELKFQKAEFAFLTGIYRYGLLLYPEGSKRPVAIPFRFPLP